MCYRMSEISRHPVVAATRALRFADHVTKRNEGSGNENVKGLEYLLSRNIIASNNGVVDDKFIYSQINSCSGTFPLILLHYNKVQI